MIKNYAKIALLGLAAVIGLGAQSCTNPPACANTNVVPATGTTYCEAQTVQLSWASVSGATGYDVYLDNGTATTMVSSNQSGTTYTTATLTAGTYSWRIVPRNSDGTASNCTVRNFTINDRSGEATITINGDATNNTICAGDRVTFTSNITRGGTTPAYNWLVNGTSVGTGATYSATTISNGDVVSCIVTSSENCLVKSVDTSNSITMTVNPYPTTSIDSNGALTFCAGGDVTLSAVTNGSNINWQRNTVNVGTGSDHFVTQTGSYRFLATLNGCTATSAAVAVNVVAIPDSTLTITGNTRLCTGETITFSVPAAPNTTYQWYHNGNPAGTANSLTTSNAGNYYVRITAQDLCSITSRTVQVFLPYPINNAITYSGSTNVCEGEAVVLSAAYNLDYAYQWTRNNIAIPGARSITYSATTSGDYNVIISSGNCDVTSNTVTVAVNAIPAVQITSPAADTTVCEGKSVVLNASPMSGHTYQWYRNGVLLGNGIATYVATAAGNYNVKVTHTASGCQSGLSNTAHVNVIPAPNAMISVLNGGDTTVCAGGTVALKAPSGIGYTYQWLNNGMEIPGATDQNFYTNYSGWFTVVLKNAACNDTSTTKVITVRDPLIVPVYQSGSTFSTENTFATYQWYRDNRIITGATLPSYNATYNGSYTVKVTDANGCSGISLARNYSEGMPYTKVGEITTDAVSIYPNPAKNSINIKAPVPVSVNIKTVDGKVVLQKDNATVIDLTGIHNGVYLVYVYNSQKELIKIQKIVKN